MTKQNDIPASGTEGKAEVMEWIFSQLFSSESLPENAQDGIRSYLADGTDTELKTEALGDAYLKALYSAESVPLSADGERRWSRLARELGLPADREQAAAEWRTGNMQAE